MLYVFFSRYQIKADGKFICHLAATGYTSCFGITNELCDDEIKEILHLLTVSELREMLCMLKKVGI